jgi:hypothetical protein
MVRINNMSAHGRVTTLPYATAQLRKKLFLILRKLSHSLLKHNTKCNFKLKERRKQNVVF